MALSTEVPVTSWGDNHAYIGETGTNGAMAATLTDLGSLDDNGLSIETADGTNYSLKDINGKLLDALDLEPELTIKFTLLKPSEATRGKFWDIDETTKAVKSLIQVKKMSIKLSNDKAIGSETFLAPKCSVKMNYSYSAEKGFYAECTAKILYSDAITGYFSFGKVEAPIAG